MRAIAIRTTTIMTVLAAAAGTAAADDDYWPTSQYGMEISAGGGVENFTGDRMQSATDPGAMWDVRFVLGTRSPVALEGAYVGSTQNIDSVFGERNTARLMGNGAEADVRLNAFPMEDFTPYAFAGLGWTRYDVTGADFTTADTGINDSDSLIEVPMGAGLAYRDNGFIADARFTYRMAAGEDLVIANDSRDPVTADSTAAGMDTWAVGARIGAEF
jgi:hypothetical protein